MNQKKKILFLITKSNWGGAQRYVFDLATSLDKNLFEVSVAFGGNGILKEKLLSKDIRVFSLKCLERNMNLKKELLSFKELWQIIKKERPDIVHLNSSKAGLIGSLIARIARVEKIVFTAHAWAFNENRSFISKIIIGFLHWLTVFLSHQTIAVSDSVKKQVSGFPFIKNKVITIHPGTEGFDLKTKEEARKILDHKKDSSDIWVGTISELHPVKGLLYYIDAIDLIKEECSNVFFYILGNGDQKNILEEKIKEKRLENRIILCGFIDDAKSNLKAFDFFVLPSVSEAFGYVLIESGFSNVPVIATNVGGIPEIIRNNENGILVPPQNPNELALAIKRYLHDKELREKYSYELKKIVEEKFNLKQMVEKTINLYLQKD